MNIQIVKYFIVLTTGFLTVYAHASATMTESALKNVEKKEVQTELDRKKLETIAVILAKYEFEASKLVDMVGEQQPREPIENQARKLIGLSETVLDWGRYRLNQCDQYLTRSLELKGQLGAISHASLEKDYHQDGALPKAPPECYHMKDMFIHPATVLVLTRDDPEMNNVTRISIKSEIKEVLAHTEVVRQLVLY